MVWQVIPDSEFENLDLSVREHFRIIRDNITEFRKGEDHILTAPPDISRRWNLERTNVRNEIVGRGRRRYGFFGPREPIYGDVSYFVWRGQYQTIAHTTIQLIPPTPEYVLVGIEIIGAPVVRIDERSEWVLGDYDTSTTRVSDVATGQDRFAVNFFYTTATEGDREYNGEGRQNGGTGTQPVLPDNYPDGNAAVADPPDEPPSYQTEFRPLWVRNTH